MESRGLSLCDSVTNDTMRRDSGKASARGAPASRKVVKPGRGMSFELPSQASARGAPTPSGQEKRYPSCIGLATPESVTGLASGVECHPAHIVRHPVSMQLPDESERCSLGHTVKRADTPCAWLKSKLSAFSSVLRDNP